MHKTGLTHKSAADLRDDIANNNKIKGIYGDSVGGQTFTEDLRNLLRNAFGDSAYENNWFSFWYQGVAYYCFNADNATLQAYCEHKSW